MGSMPASEAVQGEFVSLIGELERLCTELECAAAKVAQKVDGLVGVSIAVDNVKANTAEPLVASDVFIARMRCCCSRLAPLGDEIIGHITRIGY